MRAVILCVWLLIPAVVAAYHYGPGQERQILDDATLHLRAADANVQQEDWAAAAEEFDAALALLPAERLAEVRRVRIERAKARLQNSQLPEAYDDLTLLVEELAGDDTASPELVADARTALANTQYYLTWLLRLEGEPRESWEPEIEAARQNYRWLAEQAETSGNSDLLAQHQQDLEAAIRLARLDLSDLQALPLPSQCQSCNSGQCKCRCKGAKKSQNKGEQKQDARGASSGPPPDGRGT
jgi:hypothetical protein